MTKKQQSLNSVWKSFQMKKRDDLEDLYTLVKARYGSTRPVKSMDYLLWNDMKIMGSDDGGVVRGVVMLVMAAAVGRCASAGVVDDRCGVVRIGAGGSEVGGGVAVLERWRRQVSGTRHGLVRGLPKLKFEKDHMCSACAMGKSKKKSHTPKSEDTNQEKLYLLHMDLCGPCVPSVNRKEVTSSTLSMIRIIETIHVDFDEPTAMASEHSSSGPALHEMTPATISLGLVPNLSPSTPFVPPSRSDWDILFQPLFDELLTPPPSVDHPAPKVIAPTADVVALEPVASTSSPSTTIVEKDVPSPSNS
ncbi:hypothetical protein Tco_0122984 [Tanacetum coccineum]